MVYHSIAFTMIIVLQPMPDFNNLSLQEHGGGGGVADDPYGTHSSRPSFYGGCGYSREYWRNLAGPDYHRGGAKLSPGSVPRHGPSSPRHASPGLMKNHPITLQLLCTQVFSTRLPRPTWHQAADLQVRTSQMSNFSTISFFQPDSAINILLKSQTIIHPPLKFDQHPSIQAETF